MTILDQFWDFLKRLKKVFLGFEKRFYLGLIFIGCIFLEKIHGIYSPMRITRLQCSPANNRFPSKWLFSPWKAFLFCFELDWTFMSQENTWSIFARANKQIPVIAWRITRFPSKSFYRSWKASLCLNHFWVFLKRPNEGPVGLENCFYLGLILIGRVFLEKMAKFREKVKWLTLTFWRFWTSFEMIWKDSKRFFMTWIAFLSWFDLHWTYISQENTWDIFDLANNKIPVSAGRITDSPQKGSLVPEKRFYLGLSFIRRIFLEKIDEVYSTLRITRF